MVLLVILVNNFEKYSLLNYSSCGHLSLSFSFILPHYLFLIFFFTLGINTLEVTIVNYKTFVF